ncbi:MAG: phosphopantothenoylcysteine synthase [Spirochaetaceae bacterium]|jgi:phosphopantothenate-cysteine ligase|nr:phosphopantothenoylcysteine synthase [Spirochaetaceae bacterium]
MNGTAGSVWQREQSINIGVIISDGNSPEMNPGTKKYKFLVSSGGTREKIDEVRSITNSSTGELGRLVCGALAEMPGCEKIFYVCGPDAAHPDTDKADVLPVSDADSAAEAVKNILSKNYVDGIVHAMAVSDYRVKSVKTSGGVELERRQKIASGKDDLLLTLEATPKIISLFSRLAPQAVLVGFKLLCGATKETLIDAAFDLLQKNNCTFVIANDKYFITESSHKAYLIDRNKNITEYHTKKEIAAGIAVKIYSTLNERRA